jgi:hypothetical protein
MGIPASKEQKERARELYESETINIDDDAEVSEYDDGYWVQAWVDVPNETDEDEYTPEQARRLAQAMEGGPVTPE